MSNYEQKLMKIAENLDLKLYFSEGIINVRSRFGNWMLIMKDEETVDTVFHENYRFGKSSDKNRRVNAKRFNGNYHVQKLRDTNIYSILTYIKFHDQSWISRKPQCAILAALL